MVWPAGRWRSLFISLAKYGSKYGAAKLTAGLGLHCIYTVLGLQTLSMHDQEGLYRQLHAHEASTLWQCTETKSKNLQGGSSLLISSTLSVQSPQVCIRRPFWLSAGVKKSHWARSQITWYSYVCSSRCCEKNTREEKKCQSRSGCVASRGNPMSRGARGTQSSVKPVPRCSGSSV